MAKKEKSLPVTLPTLKKIKPITIHQNEVFKAFHLGDNLCLHGVAGTGKTFISLYLALSEVLSYESKYEKVIIIRSVVPSREIGYLPGNVKEKIEVYESPYRDMCHVLMEDFHGYELLKSFRKLEFQTTSHLRGLTFHDAIVLVDEIQNLSYHELATTITRAGDNCRFIYCGDRKQSDLHGSERDGVVHFLNIIKSMPSFCTCEFEHSDIVRGSLVKEFLLEEDQYYRELRDKVHSNGNGHGIQYERQLVKHENLST